MKKPHYDVILNHLKKNKKGITSMDAFELYGITRLSATIFLLRKDGYIIATENESCVNRFGSKVSFARYKLVEKNG